MRAVRHLRSGHIGADVTIFQRSLNLEIRSGTVPGRKATIRVDGIAGPATFKAALQVTWFYGFPFVTRQNLQRGIIGKWVQDVLQSGKQNLAMKTRRRNRLEARQKNLADKSRMSPHFHIVEFKCHNGELVPQYAIPALKQLCTAYLEPLRAEFGPVRITSGYRPEAYNRSIGGATSSLHRYELHRNAVAADVVPQRGTPTQWAAFMERFNPPGLGTYPRSGFIHIDNRTRVGMPRSRWSG